MGMYLDGFFGNQPGSLYSKLREEFDYLSKDDFDHAFFFKYKGQWYDIGEFVKTTSNQYSSFDYRKWDGYHSETVWSGILVKNNYDNTVTVGRYYS